MGEIYICADGATKDSPNRRCIKLHMHKLYTSSIYVMCLLLQITLGCVNGVTGGGGGGGGHMCECACCVHACHSL